MARSGRWHHPDVAYRERDEPVRSKTNNRQAINVTGIVLLLIGAALVLLSAFADRLDIGGGQGFGYQQLIATIIGITLILGGVRLMIHPWFNRMTRTDLPETYQ